MEIGLELPIAHGGKLGDLSERLQGDQNVCPGSREKGIDIGKIRPAEWIEDCAVR